MRPKGIIETKPRRTRNDIGKKRKTYAGKPCKHKKRKAYYKRKTGNKKSLWLRAYWRVPMSKDGYLNIHKNARPKMSKEVTNMKMSPTFRDTPLNLIDTKKKMEEFIAKNCWSGKNGKSAKFVIMGGADGKTKTGFRPVAICTIIVKETPEGNVGKMISNKRLSKYRWFYNN